jgi:signal transduction histidine kinase
VHDGEFGGWVVVSVRADDLLSAALGTAGVTGVTTALTETSPEGVTRDVANWSQGGDGTPVGDAVQRLDSTLAEYTWRLTVRPTTPLVGAARSAAAPLTMLGATLLSLALAGMVLVAGGARNRAAEHARAAADELAVAQERARRAEEQQWERESELAGFAATAGESLHAPLHAIAGFTDLLLEESPQLDEDSRGFLTRIGGATRRMLTVVDELVAYASAGDAALKLEPVESALLALDVAADRLQGPGERPIIDVGELPAVSADAVLLRRVLDQFVDNAVRFVRHGTTARIGIGARELDGGWWRFEVADRGIGVAEEHRAKIFAPFHRAPSAEGYPGAGLGLAVCARIVAMHGGEIGVDPNPGGGSIFWFTMSAADLREPVPA